MDDASEELQQYDFIDDDYFEEAVKKYSQLIGKFLMLFSSLENELNITISEIINDRSHEIGYTIMERMGMRNKIDLFFRMYNMFVSIR